MRETLIDIAYFSIKSHYNQSFDIFDSSETHINLKFEINSKKQMRFSCTLPTLGCYKYRDKKNIMKINLLKLYFMCVQAILFNVNNYFSAWIIQFKWCSGTGMDMDVCSLHFINNSLYIYLSASILVFWSLITTL